MPTPEATRAEVRPGPLGWPVEQEERLRELWAEGLSGSAIAAIMGGGQTKNSVIGKARRLKLPERPSGTKQWRVPRPTLPHKLPGNPRLAKGDAWLPLAGSFPVALLDLKPGTCRWPVTDDKPFLFCGHDSGQASYCPAHAAINVRRIA